MNTKNVINLVAKVGLAIGTITTLMAIFFILYINYLLTIPSGLKTLMQIFWYSSLTSGILIIVVCTLWIVTSGERKERAPISVDIGSKPIDHEQISRLLPESEEEIFSLIVEHGGEIRQSELVKESGMSKAKVSRILDILEGKDLVIRVRAGMGNIVKINRK